MNGWKGLSARNAEPVDPVIGTTHSGHSIVKCELLTGTRSAEGIMASGHVNRIKRPDTWLPRPKSCDVREILDSLEPSTHGPLPNLFVSSVASAPEGQAA
jgi:hypothetical protein